ncbi:MAG: 4Fe-4S binding protein [Candidatus Bathyarchaeia archaeon]
MESKQQYLSDGIIRLEDLVPSGSVPPAKRLRDKRPVAMVECIEEIPCNSCAIACKLGAIQMATVNDIPKVDYDKCTGCMACVMVCPGLAVFLLRATNGVGYVTLPYEFLPIPKVGTQVRTVDREGTVLGKSRVARVLPPERNDGTALVTIEVPEDWLFEARAIKVEGS